MGEFSAGEFKEDPHGEDQSKEELVGARIDGDGGFSARGARQRKPAGIRRMDQGQKVPQMVARKKPGGWPYLPTAAFPPGPPMWE